MSIDGTVSPRNRARTSATEDDLQPESLERDENFWYEDGTIILIAATVGFRVYRGPLAKHSPVLRDMLSFPQPPVRIVGATCNCNSIRLSDIM